MRVRLLMSAIALALASAMGCAGSASLTRTVGADGTETLRIQAAAGGGEMDSGRSSPLTAGRPSQRDGDELWYLYRSIAAALWSATRAGDWALVERVRELVIRSQRALPRALPRAEDVAGAGDVLANAERALAELPGASPEPGDLP